MDWDSLAALDVRTVPLRLRFGSSSLTCGDPYTPGRVTVKWLIQRFEAGGFARLRTHSNARTACGASFVGGVHAIRASWN